MAQTSLFNYDDYCKGFCISCIIRIMNVILLAIFTLFSAFSFGAILFGTDPFSANILIRILFFTSLSFLFIGAFSITGLWISKIWAKPLSMGTAFRRGFLLAMLMISLLLLETFSALNIINALAAFLIIVAIEFSAVSYRIKHGT